MDVPLKKKTYGQKYRKEWEVEFKWVKPVMTDETKAFCSLCHSEMYAKVNDLRKHASTKKHKEKCEITSKNKRIEFVPATKVTNKSSKAEGLLALYIAEHSALLHIDHLIEILKKCFNDSPVANDLKMHRTKCTEIIKNVLTPHFKQVLLDDINTKKNCILIDESTDLSVSKLLGVVIRYFSSQQDAVVSSFLALEPLKNSDAEGIVTALINCLNTYGLNVSNMIGLGTDNASVMTGINNGVHTILKTKHGLPNLILVRCVCHSLQLAVTHASEDTLPRSIEFLIRETYKWFSHSPKRCEEYRILFETINCGEQPLKILRACDTRWLSIEPAVARILTQWEELKLHLSVTKDKCYMADLLHAMYSDEVNRLYIYFLRSILNEVQTAVKSFEGEKSNPLYLLNELMALFRSICNRVILPNTAVTDKDYLIINLDRHLNPCPYLGYLFESHLSRISLPSSTIDYVRKRCINFNVKLAKELQARLPSNYLILEKMTLLSAESTLRQGKDNSSLAELTLELGYDDNQIDKILQQWQNINFIRWENTTDVVKFWAEVKKYKDASGTNTFEELCDLATSVLTMPHSNAEVERIFSTMNIVKSKLRNRMSVSTLNSIMFLRNQLKIRNSNCFTYELPNEVIAQIRKDAKYSFRQPNMQSMELDQPSTSQNIVTEVNEPEEEFSSALFDVILEF